jgi:hypothetical protein
LLLKNLVQALILGPNLAMEMIAYTTNAKDLEAMTFVDSFLAGNK